MRKTPRVKLPAMYTLVRAKRTGQPRFNLAGHIYDISASGMRFELDNPIEPGTPVEVKALLPGRDHTTVNVAGHIVRRHDDVDEPGPVRMVMAFDRFKPDGDYDRLVSYLHTQGV